MTTTTTRKNLHLIGKEMGGFDDRNESGWWIRAKEYLPLIGDVSVTRSLMFGPFERVDLARARAAVSDYLTNVEHVKWENTKMTTVNAASDEVMEGIRAYMEETFE